MHPVAHAAVHYRHLTRRRGSQALAAALGIESGLQLIEEEAVDHSVGPADVGRIAAEIEKMRHADEDCENWCIRASRRLEKAEASEVELRQVITTMEQEMAV